MHPFSMVCDTLKYYLSTCYVNNGIFMTGGLVWDSAAESIGFRAQIAECSGQSRNPCKTVVPVSLLTP